MGSTTDASASTSAAVTTDVLVAGMTCSHCVSSVTEELSAIDGVESVAVDLNAGGISRVTIHSATRIERKLNKLPGVEATVNYAAEKARVRGEDVDSATLIAAVESAGYQAALPAPPVAEVTGEPGTPVDRDLVSLRQRLLISTALSAPVAVLSMVPMLQFDYWQW